MTPYSVYVHIPFCIRRCSYCDFNTTVGTESAIPAYIDALCKEIQSLAASTDKVIPVHTLYFGGGTPSLLLPSEIERILKAVDDYYDLSQNQEISLEANPGTLAKTNLTQLKTLGVNRLSLGMQSANPEELVLLGRRHSVHDSIQAINWARQAEYKNLSLDLIFGLPGQFITTWEKTINLALGLDPNHFSIYGLSIEDRTPMKDWVSHGLIANPDQDLAADMYELACDLLENEGYKQYEISNWSKPQFECHHNLQYWRNLPYLGFGAGAHGYVPGFRTINVESLGRYIQRFGSRDKLPVTGFPSTPATKELVPIDRDIEMRETLMMGLRLTREGVSENQFQLRFGQSLRDRFGLEISKLVDWDLLEWCEDILRLTPNGRLLGNQVFQSFV